MLVLTRSEDQALKIGDCITIYILKISGGQVRFGVEAPPDIPIYREEVHQRMQQEQAANNE